MAFTWLLTWLLYGCYMAVTWLLQVLRREQIKPENTYVVFTGWHRQQCVIVQPCTSLRDRYVTVTAAVCHRAAMYAAAAGERASVTTCTTLRDCYVQLTVFDFAAQ